MSVAHATCPGCGKGTFLVMDNREAPIPNPPITVHDDEGRRVEECPRCAADLSVLGSLVRDAIRGSS